VSASRSADGASTHPSQQCTVCGRLPVGRYELSVQGESTCVHHPVAVRCVFCDRPHPDAAPPGWVPFSPTMLRCPTCLAGAVETQEQARALLPSVRARMTAIGVALAERVRVRVVGADEINRHGGSPSRGVLLGLTDQWVVTGGPTTVSGIRVVAGMPPTYFGRAVAHEIGHAWLAQYGHIPVAHEVEEGLCELFAYAWLKRERSPLADTLRSQLRANPDPVYGGGFRTVHAAVDRHGIENVFTSLLTNGALP
jgi:hypothetical protein